MGITKALFGDSCHASVYQVSREVDGSEMMYVATRFDGPNDSYTTRSAWYEKQEGNFILMGSQHEKNVEGEKWINRLLRKGNIPLSPLNMPDLEYEILIPGHFGVAHSQEEADRRTYDWVKEIIHDVDSIDDNTSYCETPNQRAKVSA